MLSKDRLFAIWFALILLPPPLLFAQEDPDCEQDLQACLDFKVTFDLFCSNDEDASFELGIDPDTFDLSLTAFFETAPKQNKFKLYFADGDITPGQGQQVKVTSLKCSGATCRNTITPQFAESLEDKFNFDQTFINVVLRNGVKDFCIGKFTNNEATVAANSELDRYFCAFNPLTATTLEGEGFFDPAGLSADGRLHMKFAGAEAGETINACRLVGKKYRSVFKAKAVAEGETDTDIYGSLSSTSQAALTSWPDLYSYDFANSISATSRALTKSVSAIFNKSFGTSSAKKQLGDATKQRRKRRRQKRKNNNRSLLVFEQADEVSHLFRKKSALQTFEDWLTYDPNFDLLYVSKNCKGDVPSKAVGTISCASSISGRNCVDLENGADGTSGSTCKEAREGYSVFTVRATGLAAGQYTICVDGNADSNSLTVSQGDDATFGQIELVDDSSIASAVERFQLTGADISNISDVGLSADGDCNNLSMGGSF